MIMGSGVLLEAVYYEYWMEDKVGIYKEWYASSPIHLCYENSIYSRMQVCWWVQTWHQCNPDITESDQICHKRPVPSQTSPLLCWGSGYMCLGFRTWNLQTRWCISKPYSSGHSGDLPPGNTWNQWQCNVLPDRPSNKGRNRYKICEIFVMSFIIVNW